MRGEPIAAVNHRSGHNQGLVDLRDEVAKHPPDRQEGPLWDHHLRRHRRHRRHRRDPGSSARAKRDLILPTLATRGRGTSYASAFEALRHTIPADIALLKASGLQVELRSLVTCGREEGLRRRDYLLAQHADDYGRPKLRWVVSVLSGYAFGSEGFATSADDGVRLLRGINVAPGRLRWDDVVYWPFDEVRSLQRFALRAGDLVLGLDRPRIADGLRVANISSQDLPALLLQRVACLRARTPVIELGYVQAWLESAEFSASVSTEMTGVSVPHSSPGQVGSFRIPLPPIDEQRSFVSAIADRQRRLDALTAEADRVVEGLVRYRDALITEAVTGHLDVSSLSETQLDEGLDAVREGERPEVLAS